MASDMNVNNRANLCIGLLQEKCREKNTDLHMVFVDLAMAFDIIPRGLVVLEKEKTASRV